MNDDNNHDSGTSQLRARCTDLVVRLGLASSEDVLAIEPLTGGVASDIASVDLGNRTVVVKFALEKLRVAEEWHAPVDRNRAEYQWLEFAGLTVPSSAPLLFGRDADLNGFAMEMLQGEDIYLWKTALLARHSTPGEAEKVGRTIGEIHAASSVPGFDASPFQNQQDFYDLRLEPYLVFTSARYPDLRQKFQALIEESQDNSSVLIHGDVSPKNILFRAGRPVLLDAECATMGDPAFDVAFCLNHLLLKSFHMPDMADELHAELRSFWAAYVTNVTWEDTLRLESRVCRLLPALMLSRIDGKSPVEYLSNQNRDRIREFTLPILANPPRDLDEMVNRVGAALKR